MIYSPFYYKPGGKMGAAWAMSRFATSRSPSLARVMKQQQLRWHGHGICLPLTLISIETCNKRWIVLFRAPLQHMRILFVFHIRYKYSRKQCVSTLLPMGYRERHYTTLKLMAILSPRTDT